MTIRVSAIKKRKSTDNVTPAARSRIMSAVKQKDSKIERSFRFALWSEGVRYRKNVRVFGTPDLLIARARIVIFIDSCFWHGCRWHYRVPRTNAAFWQAKIDRNRARDRKVSRHYRRKGWTVLRFWEHELDTDLKACVAEAASIAVNRSETKSA
jgi:DNA mismatch endonuclease, patch repair protein